MQIAVVNGKQFALGLSKVVKVKSANAVLPLVEMVHAKTVKGGIVLTATNLETTITAGILAEVQETGKEFMIPHQACVLLQQLKEESISIELSDILTFKFGDNQMKFPLEKPNDFPKTPEVEDDVEFIPETDARSFVKALATAKTIASSDELRQALTGVYWTDKVIAATDTHRLIQTEFESGTKEKFKVILSKVFITALSAIDGASNNLKVRISEDYISVNDKTTKVVSRLISSVFPDYTVVIPEDYAVEIETDRLQLLENINRALTIATTTDRRLMFTFDKDGYSFTGSDTDFENEIKLKGECKWTKNGVDTFSIALNGNFLKHSLDLLTGEYVTFHMNQSNKAVVFKENGTTLLQMPLLDLKETKK